MRAWLIGVVGMVIAGVVMVAGALDSAGVPHGGQEAVGPVIVRMDTEKGVFEIEVDVAAAPMTAANFLRYVDAGLYDGGVFHRTVRPDTEDRIDYPIEVIQARGARLPGRGRGRAATREGGGGRRGRGGFDPIPLERTSLTGILHRDGVVSMARSTPDSATHQFFVCIGDQPELDFGGRRNADGQGFAAFGRVVSGMDVIRAIQASPVEEGSQTLDPPITITRAVRSSGGGR